MADGHTVSFDKRFTVLECCPGKSLYPILASLTRLDARQVINTTLSQSGHSVFFITWRSHLQQQLKLRRALLSTQEAPHRTEVMKSHLMGVSDLLEFILTPT